MFLRIFFRTYDDRYGVTQTENKNILQPRTPDHV